jgi:hypothetical protein
LQGVTATHNDNNEQSKKILKRPGAAFFLPGFDPPESIHRFVARNAGCVKQDLFPFADSPARSVRNCKSIPSLRSEPGHPRPARPTCLPWLKGVTAVGRFPQGSPVE